jgi:hypothetical protein
MFGKKRKMTYSIELIEETRESFGPYRYRIFKGGKEFAIFWHDYRGECDRIRISSSEREESPPFGMCSEFLTGGGPLPLGLSKRAVSYLDSL